MGPLVLVLTQDGTWDTSSWPETNERGSLIRIKLEDLDATRTRVRATQDGAAAAADGADGAGGGGGGGGGGEASMQTPAAMLKRKKEQLLRSM